MVNLTIRNINYCFIQYATIFIQDSEIENVICKITLVAILFEIEKSINLSVVHTKINPID